MNSMLRPASRATSPLTVKTSSVLPALQSAVPCIPAGGLIRFNAGFEALEEPTSPSIVIEAKQAALKGTLLTRLIVIVLSAQGYGRACRRGKERKGENVRKRERERESKRAREGD